MSVESSEITRGRTIDVPDMSQVLNQICNWSRHTFVFLSTVSFLMKKCKIQTFLKQCFNKIKIIKLYTVVVMSLFIPSMS